MSSALLHQTTAGKSLPPMTPAYLDPAQSEAQGKSLAPLFSLPPYGSGCKCRPVHCSALNTYQGLLTHVCFAADQMGQPVTIPSRVISGRRAGMISQMIQQIERGRLCNPFHTVSGAYSLTELWVRGIHNGPWGICSTPPDTPTVIIALQVLSVLQLPICVLPIAGQRLAEGARAGHTVTGPIVRQGQRKGVAPPTGDADDPPPVGAPCSQGSATLETVRALGYGAYRAATRLPPQA